MILLGLGANLPSEHGTPAQTLEVAKKHLIQNKVEILASSRTWLSAPVPFNEDHPWYANAVVAVKTELYPAPLLALLQDIEADFGRIRTIKDAPRILDLDLLAYNDEVMASEYLTVPHPRLHERAFVLKPLMEITQEWVHPYLNKTLMGMIRDLDPKQKTTPLAKGEEYRNAG